MGEDAVLPFLEEARRQDRGGGVFVLVATSNPSSRELQQSTDPPLFELAAGLVAKLGKSNGDYPDAGAVVGVTRPEIGARVRELLPDALFLSPGYGAQGGDASGVHPLLDRHGSGVLANSSRSILDAYETSTADDKMAAREAARRTRDELRLSGATCRALREPPTNGSAPQIEKACETASIVTSTVATATTTARICTRLSLVISSFPGAVWVVSGR